MEFTLPELEEQYFGQLLEDCRYGLRVSAATLGPIVCAGTGFVSLRDLFIHGVFTWWLYIQLWIFVMVGVFWAYVYVAISPAKRKTRRQLRYDLWAMIVTVAVALTGTALHARLSFKTFHFSNECGGIDDGLCGHLREASAERIHFLCVVTTWMTVRNNTGLTFLVFLPQYVTVVITELLHRWPNSLERIIGFTASFLLLLRMSSQSEFVFRSFIHSKLFEAKELEKEQKRTYDLMQLQRSIFSKITHDLKTPLEGVVNSADFIKEELKDEGFKPDHSAFSHCDTIEAGSHYMLSLTNNLLEISRMQHHRQSPRPLQSPSELLYSRSDSRSCWKGRLARTRTKLLQMPSTPTQPLNFTLMELACDWCRFLELIENVLKINWPAIRMKGLQFDVEWSSLKPLAGWWVWVDKTRFTQCLNNVINNATKYTDRGSIHIWLECGVAGHGIAELQKFHETAPNNPPWLRENPRHKSLTARPPESIQIAMPVDTAAATVAPSAAGAASIPPRMPSTSSLPRQPDKNASHPRDSICSAPDRLVTSGVEAYRVCIGVRDSGKGIDKAKLSAIFDDFAQARSMDSLLGQGLGLGISRAILLNMGGDCILESENRGTTAKLRFLVYGAHDPTAAPASFAPFLPVSPMPSSRAPSSRPSVSCEKDRAKGTVSGPLQDVFSDMLERGVVFIVCDDDYIKRLALSRVFVKLGLPASQLVVLENGQQLLEKVASLGHSAEAGVLWVLSDLQMPNVNGYEAAEMMREWQREGRVALPIHLILCTAQAKVMLKAEYPAVEEMFDEIIEKPVTRDTVIRLITEFRDTLPSTGQQPHRSVTSL
ncbi:unnamed protein product [Vitrella brassicaformis CCMP3155]|uniref:histidine kinase n=2 Tax=Vitrella brassicaformis TaxID=1169539 RepID=A0A0G4FI83_VITBC|nr:unnamed protein product [Vitrella brassicaformis CCMP3155]|eukprot:CEM13129.1 unnamed protein product [Vitrella brassicaformis CCMP3155]